MKICIITYDEYINIPYIQKYENIMEKYNIDYDIILWDRRNLLSCNPIMNNNYFIFKSKVKKSKISKIIPFYKWKLFTLNILKTNKYDKIIILTTLPAILINKYLVKKYTNKFLLDIRDFTYENFKLYKKNVDKLVEKSALTFISSEGFRDWLKISSKINLTHNISNIDKEKDISFIDLNTTEIIIGFVGGIRYYVENCKIINTFKNVPSIKLVYIGKTHEGIKLEKYCLDNKINNVIFKPAFQNNEKPAIYESIDIINSVYGSKNQIVKTALPNKLYDCIVFKKPIMVSDNTYLSEIVKKYHLGFCIDVDNDNIYQKLLNYIEDFNYKLFLKGCSDFKDKVLKEEKQAEVKLKEFLDRI